VLRQVARHRGRLLPALLFLLAGCASIPPSVGNLPDDAVAVELEATPFFPQEHYQCGPAALTTTLVASGAEVSLDDIVRKVYLPGRKGSLQVDMLGATRTSGRIPYLIDGTMPDLYAELAAGRPVVVLQNLGVAAIPRWHYAVAVGIDPESGDVILRSGTDRRRITAVDVFLRTWRRSDYWGFVVLRPGDLPANVDRVRYLESVTALEQAGQYSAAVAAWRAGLERWPDNSTALFGLGNAAYAQGNHADAEAAYRRLLDLHPDINAARNNLAMALAQQGRFDDALRQVDMALKTSAGTPLELELQDTLTTILGLRDVALRED
jgi:Tetratricopeptide repeat